MIIYMNIYNFTQWFLGQVYYIIQTSIGYLDQVVLAPNVSLLDFTITIAIIGVFITIIITIPSKTKIGKEKRKNDK